MRVTLPSWRKAFVVRTQDKKKRSVYDRYCAGERRKLKRQIQIDEQQHDVYMLGYFRGFLIGVMNSTGHCQWESAMKTLQAMYSTISERKSPIPGCVEWFDYLKRIGLPSVILRSFLSHRQMRWFMIRHSMSMSIRNPRIEYSFVSSPSTEFCEERTAVHV